MLVLFLTILARAAVVLIVLLMLLPSPIFAYKIYVLRQGTTLALGCDLNHDFITTTKVLKYDQPNKLTFNCDRAGGDIELKKFESIFLRCLHDNPLTIARC
jgi:hypothetical protein